MINWHGDGKALTFTIDGKELKNLHDWLNNHECAAPGPYDMNIYPHHTYEFSPDGMGIYLHVSCSRCGRKQDMTDVSAW